MSLLQNALPPRNRLEHLFTWGDAAVILFIAVLLYGGVRPAFDSLPSLEGPHISLEPGALPRYTLLSLERMTAAYALSLLFTLTCGRLAAYNRRAESILMPLLDVLQSVPILSFLPVVLLGLSAVLPQNIAAEIARPHARPAAGHDHRPGWSAEASIRTPERPRGHLSFDGGTWH